MKENGTPQGTSAALMKGRRYFVWLAMGTLSLGVAVAVEEVVTWNAPIFLIGQGVVLGLLALVWRLLAKGHGLRWVLFGVLLLASASTFLLGGLHMKDLQAEALDPLCYWLAGGALAFLGCAGFSVYSLELDVYFRWLAQQRLSPGHGSDSDN